MGAELQNIARKLIVAMLRPVVRLAMKHLIPYQEVVDMLRRQYVSLAIPITNSNGKKLNLSRVAVLTGLHRRDIKACLLTPEKAPSKTVSVITRLLHLWQTHPRFAGRKGQARMLSFRGQDNDFRALVREVAVSVDAGAMLKELLRLNYVVKEEDSLKLVAQANVFSGQENLSDAMQYLETEVQQVVETTLANLVRSTESTPHVLLRTNFDNIPSHRLEEIKIWFRKRADLLHEEIRSYLSLFDRDVAPQRQETEAGGGTIEARFSSVSFVEEVLSPATGSAEVPIRPQTRVKN